MITVSLCVKLILYCLISAFLLGFCYYFSKKRDELYVWNQGHSVLIWVLLFICILYCFSVYLIPFYAMPFGFLSVILLLLSGKYCGIMCYQAVLVFYTVFFSLSGTKTAALFLLGSVGFLLFYNVERNFRYYGSVAVFLVSDLILYCGLMFDDDFCTPLSDFFMFSAIRILISACILLIFMKVLHDFMVCKDDNFYAQINDPEHELLMHLKIIDEDAYFHAIHTAYFAEKAARLIGADLMLSKALGYYHRIGLLQGKDTIQNTLTVAASYHFPIHLQNAMQEYGIKTIGHVSREAAIVQICDAYVSSITFLFQKESKAEMDYEKLMDVIIKKKFESHDFENCTLTLHEIYQIKKEFAQEKQYYDFLRRK